MKVTSKQFTIQVPSFALHHGGQSGTVFVRCTLFGSFDLPVVAVLGGISANHLVTDDETTGESGWWSDVFNDKTKHHGLLNGSKVSALSFEYITLKESTTEHSIDKTPNTPQLSTFDQAHVLASILKHLNIPSLLSVIGCSYGGMVAQAFTSSYPHLTQSLVCLVSAHKNSIRSQALRLIQRQILQLESGNNTQQIALARALAIMTYRGVDEFDQRFNTLSEAQSYLDYNGMAFAKSFSAQRYEQLSASIDNHQIDPAGIKVPTLLIAIDSDQLVPVSLVKTFADGIQAPCNCHIISSPFGHDGFLKEFETIKPLLNDFLTDTIADIFTEQQHDTTTSKAATSNAAISYCSC